MILALRCIMILTWLVLVAVQTVFAFEVGDGDFSALFEGTEFESLGGQHRPWMGVTAVVLSICAVIAATIVLWSIHRVLGQRVVQDFAALARQVRRIAGGLAGFWLVTGLLPDILIGALILVSEIEPEMGEVFLPIDGRIFLLFVAGALFVLSKAFERAEAVDDENRHFL